jgi:hypothetical protein
MWFVLSRTKRKKILGIFNKELARLGFSGLALTGQGFEVHTILDPTTTAAMDAIHSPARHVRFLGLSISPLRFTSPTVLSDLIEPKQR